MGQHHDCLLRSLVGQVSNVALLIISDRISNFPRGRRTAHPSPSSLHVLCRCVCLYISTCPPHQHLQTFIVRDTRQLWNSIELELVFSSFQRWEPARSHWWQVRGWRVVVAGAVIRLSFTRTSESKQESSSSCWKPDHQWQQYGPECFSCALYAL